MKLIYLSPVHWQSYAQRPHFMIRSLLDNGIRELLWLNPYCARLPRWSDLQRRRSLYDQNTALQDRVEVLRVPALPLEPLPVFSRLNALAWTGTLRRIRSFVADGRYILGIGRPVRLGLTLLRRLRPAWSFYDAMDDFPEFHSGASKRAMACHELAIASAVDTVITSSTYLQGKFHCLGLRPKLIRNGCEIEAGSPPSGCRHIPPVLGYLGTMGSWFDWDLVHSIARQVPDIVVRLIGPVFDPPGCDMPGNVEILPPCSHDEVRNHMAGFSAGLIPFRVNALTRGVDPIKYYEYRSLGLPVLTTRFGEMRLREKTEGVFFLDEGESLPSLLARAFGWAAKLDAREPLMFYRQNNWSVRFSGLIPRRYMEDYGD
ncbi:MAG TPA: glycosyl transferase [Desulfobulbaceae bacterium]|nr:glycosyl transferase [Desulfobulbaceae bacterium]